MLKIEFIQPKPRVEDWRIQLNGRTVGSVWRAGDHYVTSLATTIHVPTKEAAFKAARQQAERITGA